jgi:hypothetical protein
MKNIIKKYLYVIIIIYIILYILSIILKINIVGIYVNNMRTTLFIAFLAMGTFTLSLMSMFMFSLKEKLFDDPQYIELYKSKNILTNNKFSRYHPFVNLSQLFILCVLCCFITSISQFTIGMIHITFTVIFCLSLALSTIILALFILYNVWKNLEVWFDILQNGKPHKRNYE